MTYSPSPTCITRAADQRLGFTRRDYEGAVSTLCAGCGHDSISARDHPGLLRARPAAAPARQALRHRLLVEDAELFPRQLARLQQRARAHAVGADRRQPRQPRPDLPRRLRRRRLRLDRPRPVRARDPARREHGLYRREQRRLRPDQGPVLGHLRPGLEDASAAWSTTTQPIDLVGLALQLGATFVARSFSGDKEQLVPLIKAALRAPGRGLHRLHQPCVAVQQPRRLDQELRLRARAQRGGEPARRHRRRAPRSPPTTRPATVRDGRPARRLGAAPAQARRRLRRRPTASRAMSLPAGAPGARARSSPACSTSTRTPTICTIISTPSTTPLNAARRRRADPRRRGARRVQRLAALRRRTFRKKAVDP